MRTWKPTTLGSVVWLQLLVMVSIHGPAAFAQPTSERADAWRVLDPLVRATNRGVALMERYEYAAAVEAFEQARKLAPGSAAVRVNLAIATYNRGGKGDLEQAEKLLDEVLRDEPDNLRALYFRGITHQYSGRDERAIIHFTRVVKLAPHDACAWYLLARSKAHLQQPCRNELERAVQENPALASAYYDLLRIAAQEGNQDEVQKLQQTFVKLRQSPLCEMVVMPQYRRMGPLAIVEPIADRPKRNVAGGELAVATPRVLLQELGAAGWQLPAGMAMADVNGDSHLDLVIVVPVEKVGLRLALLLGRADGTFVNATETSGLAAVKYPMSCAFGDYDNDNKVDLFVSCFGSNYLFRGQGDGTFEDVTAKTGTAGPNCSTSSAVFLDADHDADLDIYVCNTGSSTTSNITSPGPNQLLNNNADGTFTDIAASAGVDCSNGFSTMMAPVDIDGDRDTDLVVFNLAVYNAEGLVRVFLNDRLGKYHEEQITANAIRGYGGVLQDFNGDGRPDLLVRPHLLTRPDPSAQPGCCATGRLYLSDATATLKPSTGFDECLKVLTTWGDIYATRVADIDLDGDLDIAVFGKAGHVLLNDGWGRFVVKPNLWSEEILDAVFAVELTDLTGDGVPDLLCASSANGGVLKLVPTTLTPPANWLAITPTGDRGDDNRTRSPASGFGTKLTLRCGLHSQVITYTGLSGGLSQSQQPVIFGLNGATKADYLAFVWPDGVTQCENELAAGTHHRISEMERRVSSCPVLFAFNGERFGFISDFAGVGGLGYFVAPGQYAPPQVLEHVKIEPHQLAAKDGFYELSLCEPMEEVAYVDRLELLAIDHPRELAVYPDERLAITGPPPTHRLLCPANPIFPAEATAPDGTDCTAQLADVDRVYAYQPELDPRFVGFCQPHALVLDFRDRLFSLEPGREVYLFINGWIEYPYSQTTFAASQAGVDWQPMKIERLAQDGQWETIVPDAGAPGGMGRMIAIPLSRESLLCRESLLGTVSTGKPSAGNCKLRISTNLEIYIDQVFIAADHGTDDLTITSVPLYSANLRRLGFPMEYSPDGRHPTIYTYDLIEPTSSFKMPRGTYTRYGPVESLLAGFDDRYVILGTGDEIAVSFDARALPLIGDEMARSFILVSHTYCKDMDLYTAEPDTVEPLPFRDMSAYPYTLDERYPDEETSRSWRQRFNTRVVD